MLYHQAVRTHLAPWLFRVSFNVPHVVCRSDGQIWHLAISGSGAGNAAIVGSVAVPEATDKG